MLDYEWRVRDLVHGTILFTIEERKFTETPLFERLRRIKQTDLSNAVCPSMNTTRYEHLLGACHVAGRMTEQITKSIQWNEYKRQLIAAHPTFRHDTEKTFVRTARFYALLHDIGHFPLSHLFEDAFNRYALSSGTIPEALVNQWFGIEGYQKPHEAFGAFLMARLRPHLPDQLLPPLMHLMTKKALAKMDPLNVIKKIVDSEIDADRIDYVRRDGLMAGGEYGTYDVNRLCTSVAVVRLDDGSWDLAFEDMAITSIEALLLDRYRIYLWFHFHHKAIMIKACTIRVIERALQQGLIKKGHFTGPDHLIALRDDAWLMHVLRSVRVKDDPSFAMIRDAAVHYTRKHIASVWRRRARYARTQNKMRSIVRGHVAIGEEELQIESGREIAYEEYLSQWMEMPALYTRFKFEPIGEEVVRLYAAVGGAVRGETALDISRLLKALPGIWKEGDPQYMVHLVKEGLGEKMEEYGEREKIGDDWANATASYHVERLTKANQS